MNRLHACTRFAACARCLPTEHPNGPPLASPSAAGDFRYEDHPEVEPGTPSWIFDSNTAAARTLVAAVSAGDVERLVAAWKELELEENIDDFYRCEAAGQLLILAAQLGRAAAVKPLLALGARLDAVDEHGHQGPALLHAASGGSVSVVRALLEVSGPRRAPAL